jgi:transglutaminase-like putative cysteine protease
MKMPSVVLSVFLLAALVLAPWRSLASTLVLEGEIDEEVSVGVERVFAVPAGGIERLSFRFASPASFKSAGLEQSTSGRRIEYSPRPDSVREETDRFGNAFTIVEWTGLKGDAAVRESFTARLKASLRETRSSAPFPLPRTAVPPAEAVYLKPSEMVEADAGEVTTLARVLTTGATGEQDAVSRVLNWVVDNVRYTTPVKDYGASWTLKARSGNCQNFSHLSLALLRASGIPARMAGGLTLGRPWRVPIEGGSLLQGMGEGGHAWIEVWYPDLGWLPYDPQQSHLFVGPRHIRQAAGLSSVDVNDSWRASPRLPGFTERLTVEYVAERLDVALRLTQPFPRSYIMTASASAAIEEAALPVLPPPPAAEGGLIVFGNMDFPERLTLFAASGDTGFKTFDKETAEYVTGDRAYAQAFVIERPMRVSSVSLAMHRFGGRAGSLWVDVVKDSSGAPGMDGARSMPLALDAVAYSPGYSWFDFSFAGPGAEGPVLAPGRHWIILRRSKDAIVNWFYSPGNRYNAPDDARSTWGADKGVGRGAGGGPWANVLNLDFNFKVTGEYAETQEGR